VEDGAAAYMLLAERLAADRRLAGEAFNFSDERPMAVLDLVGLILSMMGRHLEPDVRATTTHEIRHQYLTAAKARQILGWKPLFSLEEGLQRTIAWYEDHLLAVESAVR
jgi:CDP-glucose 4,6-dehydratase